MIDTNKQANKENMNRKWYHEEVEFLYCLHCEVELLFEGIQRPIRISFPLVSFSKCEDK
jgi:hypothetical protein